VINVLCCRSSEPAVFLIVIIKLYCIEGAGVRYGTALVTALGSALGGVLSSEI